MNEPNFKNVVEFSKQFPNEESCIDYLIQARWNGKILLP
jgi:hypothetical protein